MMVLSAACAGTYCLLQYRKQAWCVSCPPCVAGCFHYNSTFFCCAGLYPLALHRAYWLSFTVRHRRTAGPCGWLSQQNSGLC